MPRRRGLTRSFTRPSAALDRATSAFALDGERDDLAEFVLAFPTDIAPIVGQQVTIGPGNFTVTDVNDRIGLIDTRAGVSFESKVLGGVVTECDVIAKTVEGGVERGYARQSGLAPTVFSNQRTSSLALAAATPSGDQAPGDARSPK